MGSLATPGVGRAPALVADASYGRNVRVGLGIRRRDRTDSSPEDWRRIVLGGVWSDQHHRANPASCEHRGIGPDLHGANAVDRTTYCGANEQVPRLSAQVPFTQ
jgi:hypothetical protein